MKNLGDVVEFVDLWELPGHSLAFEFNKVRLSGTLLKTLNNFAKCII